VLATNGAGRGPAKRLGIGQYVPFAPFFFILLEERLSPRMRYKGAEHTASLSWDLSPSLTDVEQVLQPHLGKTIRDIGELDV
jgi:hypothetical protein